MHLTYIPDAMSHGATLYDGLLATRIRLEGSRATGVEVRSIITGDSLIIDADLVISACGTIRGVPLLKRSGITNPHLGRHLSIHPASKITALMPAAIQGWDDTPQGYGIFDLIEQGIHEEVRPTLVSADDKVIQIATHSYLLLSNPKDSAGQGMSDDPRKQCCSMLSMYCW